MLKNPPHIIGFSIGWKRAKVHPKILTLVVYHACTASPRQIILHNLHDEGWAGRQWTTCFRQAVIFKLGRNFRIFLGSFIKSMKMQRSDSNIVVQFQNSYPIHWIYGKGVPNRISPRHWNPIEYTIQFILNPLRVQYYEFALEPIIRQLLTLQNRALLSTRQQSIGQAIDIATWVATRRFMRIHVIRSGRVEYMLKHTCTFHDAKDVC